MNYITAMQRIDPATVLKALKIDYCYDGSYVKFKCDCGSEAASFKAIGKKRNLFFCPSCKANGNIFTFAMEKKGIELNDRKQAVNPQEYEKVKKWLIGLSPTIKRLNVELQLNYTLEFNEKIESYGLTQDFCAIHGIGQVQGRSMLAQCLVFTIRNEKGVKIAYIGKKFKGGKLEYHKSFNPEMYIYGMNLDFNGKPVVVTPDLVECAVLLQDGKPAVCNFGLPYLSEFQIGLLNTLDRVDLKIQPNLETSKSLKVYHKYI